MFRQNWIKSLDLAKDGWSFLYIRGRVLMRRDASTGKDVMY